MAGNQAFIDRTVVLYLFLGFCRLLGGAAEIY